MSSIYGLFGTDKELESKGVEIDYGQFGSFWLARAGGSNTRFQKVLEVKTRPYRRQIENETLDKALAEKLLREAFVEAVLIKWERVTGPDGKEIPFTRDAAMKLFEDLPDLYQDLMEQAKSFNNFKVQALETDVKN